MFDDMSYDTHDLNFQYLNNEHVTIVEIILLS